jgi:hypothetical protein
MLREATEWFGLIMGFVERLQLTLGRPRHMWVDNIEMDLLEIVGRCGLNWSTSG